MVDPVRGELLFQQHLLHRRARLPGDGSRLFDPQRLSLARDDVSQRDAKEHDLQPLRGLCAGGIYPRGDLFVLAGGIRDVGVGVLDHGDRMLDHGGRHRLDRSRQQGHGPRRQRRRTTDGERQAVGGEEEATLRLPRRPNGCERPRANQRRLEPRTHGRLARSIRLHPSHPGHPLPHPLRPHRIPSPASPPSRLGAHGTSPVRPLRHISRLGQLRHLAVLHLAIPPTTPPPLGTGRFGGELPLGHHGLRCIGRDGRPDIQSSNPIHHGARPRRLLHHAHPLGHDARRANLLGPDVRLDAHHPVRDGHEFPLSHYPP